MRFFEKKATLSSSKPSVSSKTDFYFYIYYNPSYDLDKQSYQNGRARLFVMQMGHVIAAVSHKISLVLLLVEEGLIVIDLEERVLGSLLVEVIAVALEISLIGDGDIQEGE